MEKFEETTTRNLSNLMKAKFTGSKQLVNPRQAKQGKKKKKAHTHTHHKKMLKTKVKKKIMKIARGKPTLHKGGEIVWMATDFSLETTETRI